MTTVGPNHLTKRKARTEFSKFAWMKATEGYRLTALEHEVLTAIHNRAHADGTQAYVTEKKFSEKFGKSERQIRRALTKLRDIGLVERTSKGAKDKGPSIYRLLVPTSKPDMQTGHIGKSKPDIFTEANRTYDPVQTGHIKPDMGGQTGHVVSDQTGHGVSGITDPFNRSPKGSVPDPFYRTSEMSGVTVDSSETFEGLGVGEPSQSFRPAPVEGRLIADAPTGKQHDEGTSMIEHDDFELDAAAEAAMAEFYSEPDQPVRRSNLTGEARLFSDELNASYAASAPVVRWSRTKPFPSDGSLDMFAVYVDDETGEVLNFVPGKLPTLR